MVERARETAQRLNLAAEFVCGDAQTAPIDDGTVFYLPFTGPVLDNVFMRLRAIAERRPIVICALGIDLDRFGWLRQREDDDFWLAIYDAGI